MSTNIKKALIAWLVMSMFGLAVIGLTPENLFGSDRVLTLSDQHGPTISDAIGITLLLIGWLYYLWRLWVNRNLITNTRKLRFYAAIALISVFGCIIAAVHNFNLLIVIFAFTAIAAQIMIGSLVRR